MSLVYHPLVRDWLRVTGDRLLLRTGKVDLGQRISTALVRIAAEELSVATDLIDVAPVRTGSSPDEGITSGSNSIEQSGAAQRAACATARAAVADLAASELDVPVADLVFGDGCVSHRGSNRKLDVIALLTRLPEDLPVDRDAPARGLTAPLPEVEPRGLRAMTEGRYVYVQDAEREGMQHARIVRPPVLDARLVAVDAGVVARLEDTGLHVIRDGSFLAVSGVPEWAVVRAARSLAGACDWDTAGGLETGDIFELMQARPARRLAVTDGVPDPDGAVPDPMEAPDFEARIERPYTMHGALAPSAALAEFRCGKLEILTHSQGIYDLRDSIADSLGMAPDAVVLEHVPGSGCYGHNGADDAAYEAALIACAIPETPILLKYSREDEHGREPLGTAMTVTCRARLTADGSLGSLWMETRGDTHRGRPRAGPNRAGAARLAANLARKCDVPRFVPEPNLNRHAGLHRNLDPIYRVSDKVLVKALVADLPLRPSALRCLGAPANILAIESAMDEFAMRAGGDAIEYRLAHLDNPRDRAVLAGLRDLLAQAPPQEGAGRGIAYAQYKNAMTRVATAVDLRVDDQGGVSLDHVRLVADAGRVVDPDGLRAQLEGGVLQGASWALHEAVRWGPEGRETLDWDTYPVLRFDNVPLIHIAVLSVDDPQARGAGEATSAPTVAAIANAIHAATGLRLRRLPFDAEAILGAALRN